MTKPIFMLIITSFLTMAPSFSSNTQKNYFQMFIGDWQGTGTLFGTKANFSMSWKKVIGDKFIELAFENEFKTANGNVQKMTAKAIYWFIDEENLKGNWYDSRGMVLPLKATFKNNTLTSFWGNDDTVEHGKTVYKVNTEGGISVEDYVWRNEKMSQFGAATYQKAH